MRQHGVTDDGQYLDPRIVQLYDPLNPPDETTELFAQLLADRPRRVLDLGCGTGLLARRLAREGHAVTGADPAAPMLDVARANDLECAVDWRLADARTLALGRTFDAIVMTGHVFQIFTDDAEIAAVVANARAHLEPGGILAFDSRNPLARGWERWRSRSIAGVTVRYVVREVVGDLVRFTTDHVFASGETITTESTLRFLGADAIRERLGAFAHVTLYGDWDRSAFTAASPEIIAVATA